MPYPVPDWYGAGIPDWNTAVNLTRTCRRFLPDAFSGRWRIAGTCAGIDIFLPDFPAANAIVHAIFFLLPLVFPMGSNAALYRTF